MDPNRNLKHTGWQSACLRLIPRIPYTNLSFPPTFSQSLQVVLGFSDVLSTVPNASLIQKLGTSVNELMSKKNKKRKSRQSAIYLDHVPNKKFKVEREVAEHRQTGLAEST